MLEDDVLEDISKTVEKLDQFAMKLLNFQLYLLQLEKEIKEKVKTTPGVI